MYFSSHNDDVAFVNHASGLLEVEGKGPLCAEDTDVRPFGDKGWADEFSSLKVCPGVTAIGPGFLEAFPGMQVLELPRTVEAVDASEAAIGFLRKRHVLIRGAFDSFAEDFARRHGLDLGFDFGGPARVATLRRSGLAARSHPGLQLGF